ncbi:MAG: NAD(P)-dependent oxidoreductase [candidate division Zixibacteria bacterium]|nr:NAD(P)-dependent oxidoreductase [candidate division Zixibacteria bacterium]
MKIAITGGTGFLGGALAKAYINRGDDVVALARQSSNTSVLSELGVEIIYGELSDENSFNSLLKNADLGIHCAALATDFGSWDDFLTINVNGTKNFFEACLKQDCPRSIYISSVAVYGNGQNHRGTDEDAPYEKLIIDNYTRSKIAADRMAFDYYRKHNLPATIIRPGYIWGQGDRAIMPRLIQGLKNNRLAVVNNGVNLMNLSHIDNVVQGIMLAAENDNAIGKAYNITDGSKVTTFRFMSDLIDLIGVDYKLRSFPYVPAYIAAYLCESYAQIRRYKVEPPITRYTVRMGKYDQVFDISKAIFELGYKPSITYKEGMARLARYVRSLYYNSK